MKRENSNGKLLLGIGLGVLAGVAVTYLMNGEHRRKLEEDLNEVGHGIKDGVKSAFSKVKSKVERAGSDAADKVGRWSEAAGNKAEEWSDKAGNKASGVADDLSQKANDFRQKMYSKSERDDEAHSRYAQDFHQDINNLRDKTKSEGDNANTTMGGKK